MNERKRFTRYGGDFDLTQIKGGSVGDVLTWCDDIRKFIQTRADECQPLETARFELAVNEGYVDFSAWFVRVETDAELAERLRAEEAAERFRNSEDYAKVRSQLTRVEAEAKALRARLAGLEK